MTLLHRKTDTRLIRRIAIVVSGVLLVALIVYSCFSCAVNDDNVASPDEASTIASSASDKPTKEDKPRKNQIQEESNTSPTTEPLTEASTKAISKSKTKHKKSSIKKKKENKKKTSNKANNYETQSEYEYYEPADKPANNSSSSTSVTSKTNEHAKKQNNSQNKRLTDEQIYDGEFIE